MDSQSEQVTKTVIRAATGCLDDCVDRIEHATQQLNDAQIWYRHDEAMNSIGNLLLHLCGNLRQWIMAGIGDAEDDRDRPAEFRQREVISREALLRDLRATVEEAKAVLSQVGAVNLLQNRRVQGFEVNGWEIVFNSIPHFQGHTQEIVAMTRMQLGEQYQFHWQPTTPEAGAP